MNTLNFDDVQNDERFSTEPKAAQTKETFTDDIGRLLVSCRDGPGLVAAITSFLHRRGANIVQSDQYSTDPQGGQFFLRIEFVLPDLANRLTSLEQEFTEELGRLGQLEFRLLSVAAPKRVAIFVSRLDHCLLDLLWRWRRGELPMEIVQVVSNHRDLEAAVLASGAAFAHIPVTKNGKAYAEQQQLDLLRNRIDLVVLARYMQIVSETFLDQIAVPVINVHHSILPAFVGAGPYEQAKKRGVKLVGATAHYVTEELDQGPIIEQGVARITHRDSVRDIKRRGADIERTVLATAVSHHCRDRVLLNDNTTIVF